MGLSLAASGRASAGLMVPLLLACAEALGVNTARMRLAVALRLARVDGLVMGRVSSGPLKDLSLTCVEGGVANSQAKLTGIV